MFVAINEYLADFNNSLLCATVSKALEKYIIKINQLDSVSPLL